ncbi:Calcium-transporting ATPase [Quillaja saponaria]|uniref:Calcium-transporting ATPase n=1 Tax=Quillaja saponaria TaxID=32244 RepID=A0AAD7PM52_QUISA|nr:Calcium-transporting ATPase [Quillaja saponaria]
MFEANGTIGVTSEASENGAESAGMTVGASLLITSKYGKLWRRSIYVGIFISIKKTTPVSKPQLTSVSPSPLTSIPNYPIPPPTSTVVSEGPPSRTSSNKSYCALEVGSDQSDQEENDDDDDGVVGFRKKVDRIVKDKDLNALHQLGGLDQVLSIFEESTTGRNENPQVWNTTKQVHGKGFLYFLLKSCNSYTIFLLLISAGLAFATGSLEQGTKYGWHDGVAIVAAVILMVAFPSVGNFLRERKQVILLKHKNRLEVSVLRGEQSQLVSISDVVVGDKLWLKKDDQVLFDGLHVNGENLMLDEVLNPKVDRDWNPFLLSGSKVKEGNGYMLVTSVGTKSDLGEMLSSTAHAPNRKKLLETQIEKPSTYIDTLALLISVFIAFVVLARLKWKKNESSNGLPETKGNVPVGFLMEIFEKIYLKPKGKVSILTSVLTAAVIGIQHGIPLVVTISLNYWTGQVKQNGSFPRNLSACCTMGLVTVICIDVTGGLMYKLMEVNRVWMGESNMTNDMSSETNHDVLQVLRQGIGASVLAPEISGIGYCHQVKSFISWAETKWGMNLESFNQNFSIVKYKLSSIKKCSGVLMRSVGDSKQVLHLHWNGAASAILEMCSHYYDSKGECHAIGNYRVTFEKMIKDMEDSGLRPIAFACGQTEVQELEEDGLILLALMGLKQTSEEEKLALEALESGGIKIILVSEDDIVSVKAIACELGIIKPNSEGVAVEGEEINELTEIERTEKVDLATVMGSFLPKDKLLMVQSLQQKGHVVAFLGGLATSDSPALKESNVGIVEDSRCTTMARESSCLLVKNLSSLTPIVRYGRCNYHNIQKFTQLQLTAGISGLLIILVTTMCTGESPLTAIQLLWVSLIMHLLGGLMMAIDLRSQELLTSQPFQSLITKDMWRSIAIQVFYQAFVLLILQFSGDAIPRTNEDVRKTMIFSIFMLCQVFNLLNAMDLLKKEVLEVVLQSYMFLLALGGVLLMQVMVVEYAKSLADYVPLNAIQWTVCVFAAALSWVFDLSLKLLALITNSNFASRSVNSLFGFSNRRPWSNLSYLYMGLPFFTFLFLAVPYLLDSGIAQTVR